MKREAVNLADAPKVGPYSDAIWAGDLLFLSGRVGLAGSTGQLAEGGIGPETKACIANVEQVLRAAGLSLENVIRCTVYLDNMADFAGMNEVYQASFKAPLPARTAIAVEALPLGALVEIEVVAGR